jgi:hypothetical protein
MVEDRQNALNLLSITAKGPCADSATAVDFILGFADYHPSGQHRQRISGPFKSQRGLEFAENEKIDSERKAAEKARGVLDLLLPTAAQMNYFCDGDGGRSSASVRRLAGRPFSYSVAALSQVSAICK